MRMKLDKSQMKILVQCKCNLTRVRFCCEMVNMLASCMVDVGFDSCLGRTKNKLGICCFSAEHPALGSCLLGVRRPWIATY